jgi:hypothetical protein
MNVNVTYEQPPKALPRSCLRPGVKGHMAECRASIGYYLHKLKKT